MKKTKENSTKTNFTKLTRSGISLIVLVITIIVIIILAAAIILSLNNNNPIMEANTARYESDRANMQAVFTNTVAKVMAKNQATIIVSAGQINTVTGGQKEVIGEVAYTLKDAQNVENATGKIVFDNKTSMDDTVFYTGKKLPIYAAGETKWYVDDEGVVSLTVGENKYGQGGILKSLESIVIDYGLPVKIEHEKMGDSRIIEEKCYSKYGDVAIEGDNTSGNWSVIYTLNQMLSDVDTVHLVDENGQEYAFDVYPATTMYYETDFADGIFNMVTTGESWSEKTNSGDKAVNDFGTNYFQEVGKVGEKRTYGYDKKYENDTGLSLTESWFVNGQGVKLNETQKDYTYVDFSFTGTGFDLFNRIGAQQSGLRVEIFSDESYSAEKRIKSITVLSKYEREFYQVPIVSVDNLEYGTYYVRVHVNAAYTNDKYPQLSRGGEFYFDAIRIYNPAKGNAKAEAVYLKDNEAYPKFAEIGKNVVTLEEINTAESLEGIAVIENINTSANILSNPSISNCEVFLQKGQAIAFRVTDKNIVSMQLGVKSPTGQDTSIKVSELNGTNKTIPIKSATELYYDITEVINWNGNNSNIIVISNENDTDVTVSLTNIKTTYKQQSTADSIFRISLDDINSVSNEYNK